MQTVYALGLGSFDLNDLLHPELGDSGCHYRAVFVLCPTWNWKRNDGTRGCTWSRKTVTLARAAR